MEDSATTLRLAQESPIATNRRSRDSRVEDQVVALYDQLRTPVMRYFLSCGVEPADAEEMLQEVFLLLFRKLRESGGAEKGIHINPAGWVFRTAHHLLLKLRDRQRRDHRLAGGEAVGNLPDSAARPDVVMEEAQTRDRLLAVVRALSDQDQWCLHLRAEGLRYREIANVTGMSLGAVANSLRESMAKMARVSERLR